jgi:hypothetical protein
MQNANDALILLIDYLEKAQSRGAFSLREARDITNAIDFLAQPVPQPEVKEPEEKESQSSEDAGSNS